MLFTSNFVDDVEVVVVAVKYSSQH